MAPKLEKYMRFAHNYGQKFEAHLEIEIFFNEKMNNRQQKKRFVLERRVETVI